MFRILLLITLLVCVPCYGQEPAIDGVFDEWTDADIVATDPAGDATGAFDIKTVWARRGTDGLHLSIEFDKPVSLQNGDASDGTLELSWEWANYFDRMTIGPDSNAKPTYATVTVNLRKRIKSIRGTNRALRGQDKSIVPNLDYKLGNGSFLCLPTYASDRCELLLQGAIPRDGKIEITGSDSVVIRVNKLGRTGSTALKYPPQNAYVRSPEALFRIANLNTLKNGLGDPERGPKIKRLIAGMKADIYTFQEEWDGDQFQAAVKDEAFAKHRIWSGGCAIVSKFPIESVPMGLDRAVAGAVTLPDGKRVIVVSIYSKCCGYAGSREDGLRVQQSMQLVGEFKKLRAGAFGDEVKDLPVVVIGDYNLVGSRRPLFILNIAGFADVLPTDPNTGHAFTWRGLSDEESFWPGRLDLVTHTKELKPLKALILNTANLKPWQHRELGWTKKEDSAASDHLMVVCDFRSSSK